MVHRVTKGSWRSPRSGSIGSRSMEYVVDPVRSGCTNSAYRVGYSRNNGGRSGVSGGKLCVGRTEAVRIGGHVSVR